MRSKKAESILVDFEPNSTYSSTVGSNIGPITQVDSLSTASIDTPLSLLPVKPVIGVTTAHQHQPVGLLAQMAVINQNNLLALQQSYMIASKKPNIVLSLEPLSVKMLKLKGELMNIL
jgi:hypothetical protein